MKKVTENPNNFIIKSYKMYGEDFLDSDSVSIDDIQKNAIFIVKDILNNKIDLSIYGKYILNSHVIGNLIEVFKRHTEYYRYISEALEFTKNFKYRGNISHEQFCTELEVSNLYRTCFLITETLLSIINTNNISEFNILGNRLRSDNLIYSLNKI